MAINLASKFESATSELLKAKAKTSAIVNDNWSWDGVNAINIYTLTDPTMNTYTPTGSTRYGTATEVQDTKQLFTLARDRSWTNSIDMLNYQDTLEIRKPAKFLAQATKNVLVPEIDTYRLGVLSTAGAATTNAVGGTITARNAVVAPGATTSSNAYSNFTLLTANMTDLEGTEEGRVALMTAGYYNLLKQSGFVLNSDLAYKDRKSGDLGQVDNCDVVIVPSSRMPVNTDLIITHPSNLAAPEKLKDYTVHKNPPGINGYLIEFRIRYDAFFDGNKFQNLAIHKTAV
jgi:hypothetical protein